ncbi:uncharacterized protein LOC144337950 [Macaca mulatta]
MSSRGSDLFWQVSPALQELLVLWAAARGQETTSPNPADRISERKAYGKLPRTDLAHAGKTPRCQGRRQSICGSSLPITGGKEYSRTGIGRLHAAVTALGSGFFHLETPGAGRKIHSQRRQPCGVLAKPSAALGLSPRHAGP